MNRTKLLLVGGLVLAGVVIAGWQAFFIHEAPIVTPTITAPKLPPVISPPVVMGVPQVQPVPAPPLVPARTGGPKIYARAATPTHAETLIVDGTGSFGGTLSIKQLNGAAISATPASKQDDWAPAGLAAATSVRTTNTTTSVICGIVGGAPERPLLLHFSGTGNVTLANNNSAGDSCASSSGNFILTSTGGDVTFTQSQGALLVYDSTTNAWRLVASSISFGSGLKWSGGFFTYDNAVIQSRITGTCTSPNAIVAVAANGTVTCSTGLSGSGTTGTVTRFTGSTAFGNSSILDDGTTATVTGLAYSKCTDSETGGIGDVPFVDGCTELMGTTGNPSGELDVVTIHHPTTSPRRHFVYYNNGTAEVWFYPNDCISSCVQSDLLSGYGARYPLDPGASIDFYYVPEAASGVGRWLSPQMVANQGAQVFNGQLTVSGNIHATGQSISGNINWTPSPPVALSADQIDWFAANPNWLNGFLTQIDVQATTLVNIRSLASIDNGTIFGLCNTGTNPVVVTNEDTTAGVTAAYRFHNRLGKSVILLGTATRSDCAYWIEDPAAGPSSTTRWVQIGGTDQPALPGTLIGRQVFTTTATYTPSSNTNSVIIEMVGGGGGGGGAGSGSSCVAAAAGGASGVYYKTYISTGSITGGTATIGAGGAGGLSTPAAGTTGGDTSVVISGTTFTAKGGIAGAGQSCSTTATFNIGGASTLTGSSTGDVVSGQSGGTGIRLSGTAGRAGDGASGPFGIGGIGPTSTSTVGGAATGNGAGGAGGLSTGTAEAGGAGSKGEIIIYEYN